MRCIEIDSSFVLVPSSGAINRNMRCIEISNLPWTSAGGCPINRNMRCIEIYSKKEDIVFDMFD